MARQKITLEPEKFIEVKDVHGNLVKIPAPPSLGEPHKDEQLGYVPEFVNISGKVQKIAVPTDPDGTIIVMRYGIVKGAQWRHLADKKIKVWGGHPPFAERASKNGNGEFDAKYLLNIEQMVNEVRVLSDRRRIRDLIDHAVIVDDIDEISGIRDQKIADGRTREDRPEVADAALQRQMDLEALEDKRREEQGLA